MPRARVKTIADITVEVLNETDNPGVMFGDTYLLDMIAERCTHTTLMKKHPMIRHNRILTALQNDGRFEKFYVKMPGIIGNQLWRSFELKKQYRNSSLSTTSKNQNSCSGGTH